MVAMDRCFSDIISFVLGGASNHVARKQPMLPPFGYLRHALNSMKSKVFMLHIKFMNLTKDIQEASPKMNLKVVLKSWRKDTKDFIRSFNLPEVSDLACDYIFTYLMYDTWVEE